MKYTEKELREGAARALDSFDAAKVAKVMELLDWQWFNTDDTYPANYEIMRQIRKLVDWLVDWQIKNPEKTQASTGTGGLWIELDDGYWDISFKAEQSEYDTDWLKDDKKW